VFSVWHYAAGSSRLLHARLLYWVNRAWRVGTVDYLLDPRVGHQLSVLRDAVVARLLLGPVSLHGLVLDLERLYMGDVLEAPPALVDVAEEVGLLKRLGVVVEGSGGLLYLDEERLPGDVRERVEALAARMAEALGAWAVPGAGEGQVATV